jgi:hypothetical protein
VAGGGSDRQFQALISTDPPTMLVAERLRDGRLALGTRVQLPNGEWKASDLSFLDPSVQLDLVAWLTPAVETGWIDTVRHRQEGPLRTAGELYGEGPGAVTRLALDTLAEIPSALMTRAMVLLANSVGPQARQRLIERLNETSNVSEDTELRLRMADENETLAYAVAAAALFDAASRGIYPEDV